MMKNNREQNRRTKGTCVECGVELLDQRDGVMYECCRCMNTHQE